MDLEKLLDHVADAIIDFDEPFLESRVIFSCGSLLWNPKNKYYYIIKNLGWW